MKSMNLLDFPMLVIATSATLPSSDPIYFATTIVILYFYMSIRSHCHHCIASAKSGNVSFHKPKFEISLSAAIAFPLPLAPIRLLNPHDCRTKTLNVVTHSCKSLIVFKRSEQ